MNLFKKLALAAIVVSAAACADLDELLVNPNGVAPDQADAESLYNNIQLGFQGVQSSPYYFTAGLARMDAYTGGFTYNATHSPTDFDGLWSSFYAGLLPDADAFIALAEPLGQDAAAASVKIMKAYGYMELVDLFGDVPFGEAGMGGADTPITNPKADDGAMVYQEALNLLDTAIMQLDGADDFSIAYDNFYGGSAARWMTLAKTLKLRAAVNTRLVGGGAGIQEIFDEGDFIAANNENFEWHYGNNRTNPNNRHPWYNDGYENTDGQYQSTWYMWLLAESKGFVDPRTRYYFYRQTRDVYPDAVRDDPNAFDCIYGSGLPDPDVIPPHYEAISPDMPYCLGSYDMGYYGRDHLNGSGIPPDGEYRTLVGLYPAGGRFDDGISNSVPEDGGVEGALGEGIWPIWQASFTHFILAEAALTGGLDADARELLQQGIELSIARAQSFESKVDGGEIIATTPVTVTVEDTYVADSLNEEYLEYVLEEYDAADDEARLGIVAREYIIALWGNGLEAYNLYRRTCLPGDVQPAIDPNPGEFIRSALYPSVHVNRNVNAKQKTSFTDPVFWDTNDASCNY
ncbi:SusD/RagB family nutrient-binding outer membrane lipoprotein [Lewinella sp. IMCC34183]|uniref:SusD/RagB family nutrient-binding outer membrane lipoprotein n=1 Tax=Lewinella sp. IMCC34183 TaxID=2248762 RepID=UPI000E26F864|nr:SusD/RagB family nutrient-binding outer membrane lipoprotein [Lewinella sp. IMCC34183]